MVMFLEKNKRGFTFIEMIIVITIIFIMTAVLMSLSFKDRQKKEIETVAREVVASIREAQNNSLTGKQKGNTNLPCAFKFKLNDDHTYQIFYSDRDLDGVCPADTDNGVAQPFSPAIILPEGMKIKSKALSYDNEESAENYVIFLVPYGDFIVGNKDEYKGIDFVVEKDNRKYHICVHATGLIEELGFVDSEDDLACAF